MTRPSPEARFVLECIQGPDFGRRLAVSERPLRFGRDDGVDFSSHDPSVLNLHAHLAVRDNQLWIDASDHAEVIVEGRLVVSTRLLASDRVKLGESYWQVIALRSSGLANAIGQTVGLAGLEKFDLRTFFSETFRNHAAADAETLLACGTTSTTPSLDQVDASWPRPWLFSRVALLMLGAFLLFLSSSFLWTNSKLYPGLIVTGTFLVPVSILVLIFELNIPRNVSAYIVATAMVVAGGASLLFAMITFEIPWSDGLVLRGAMVAGPAEELAKLAALLAFAYAPKYRWTLNGLLLGAAVGAGFSAFESAGYAFDDVVASYVRLGAAVISEKPQLLADDQSIDRLAQLTLGLNSPKAMMETMFLRAGVTLGGLHIAWTAMVGAALWKARGNNPMTLGVLIHPYFLRTLFLAMGLHALWNSPLIGIASTIIGSAATLFATIGFGVICWTVVLAYVNDGMRQIRKAKAEHLASLNQGGGSGSNSSIEGSMVWR